MKPVCFLQKFFAALILSSLLPVAAGAQSKNTGAKHTPDLNVLSVNQHDALELLKTLARNLKSEPDKLAAAPLQAQIGDVLWQFDEAFARDAFRWSFEAARQPAPNDLNESARTAYLERQASSIKQVLVRIGTRDRQQAEALLKGLREDQSSASASSRSNSVHSELLLQIALELAPTNPEQSLQLGMHSLSGTYISPEFGRLLFALSNVSKNLADRLFRAALVNLRRNDFVYDKALLSLVNYLFSSNGVLHADATPADAQLLANYFVDASWRQLRGNESTGLPESSAMFYSLIQVRGFPIVSAYAPDRVPELQGQLRELASGLTAVQMQRTTLLQANQQQQITIANRNTYDIDEQIERAKKERDSDVRDSLLNSVAHSLMREDSERALEVAAMIDATDVRQEAENDIYLALVQKLMRTGANEEARKTASKFHRPELQARILIELASKSISNRNGSLALELLAEASEKTLKAEATPDKVILFLDIAHQFSKLDTIRGFETLGNALQVINQLKPEETTPRSLLIKPRPLRIKTYTVLNGSELSTSDRATIASINFSQLTPFVAQDYLQTRLLGNKLERPLWRAKYLTAVGSAILQAAPSRAESRLSSSN